MEMKKASVPSLRSRLLKDRKHKLALICITLILSASAVYWGTSFFLKSGLRGELADLYFFPTSYVLQGPPFNNESFIEAWNKAKQLEVISELSGYGNYSVFVYLHAYNLGLRDGLEWFITASTLLPDSKGLIHEVFLRLDKQNFSLVKSYANAYNFNLTSVENGTRTMEDFSAHAQFPPYFSDSDMNDYHVFLPYLFLFKRPSGFGIAIILNLETGRIMVAATIIYAGQGELLYPETINSFR
jgi:hypothetical protein